VTLLDVNEQGLVNPDDVRASLQEGTFAVSIMHSNNETGALQPIKEIGAILSDNIAFHCDASQSIGKVDVNVDDLKVDLLTIAGHKFYAPKGIGALYVRKSRIPSLPMFLQGAGQENGQRASTENVPYIVGMGRAAELVTEKKGSVGDTLRELRDLFEDKILHACSSGHEELVRRNGPLSNRLPNTASLSFHNLAANEILAALDDEVVASAGAACHSHDVKLSHVLEAMWVPPEWAMGTIRFSMGRFTTKEEVERAAQCVITAVNDLRTKKMEQ